MRALFIFFYAVWQCIPICHGMRAQFSANPFCAAEREVPGSRASKKSHIGCSAAKNVFEFEFDSKVNDETARLPGRSYAKANPRIELEMVANWAGLQADELFPDVLVPVCTLNLLADRPAIRSAQALIQYPLVHTSSRRYAWPDWLKAHGVGVPPTKAVRLWIMAEAGKVRPLADSKLELITAKAAN